MNIIMVSIKEAILENWVKIGKFLTKLTELEEIDVNQLFDDTLFGM